MKEISLGRGKFAKVNDDVFDEISKLKWTWDSRYAVNRVQCGGVTKKIYMHKVINNTPDGMDTDHINGDKLDNRRENLRSSTRGQNNSNMPKISKKCISSYKGVTLDKRSSNGKWRAEIKFNGKRHYLGVYDKEEDAAMAYNAKAKEFFGEFSKQNFFIRN